MKFTIRGKFHPWFFLCHNFAMVSKRKQRDHEIYTLFINQVNRKQ